MLVDPGRDVPEESRRIHGLDRQALQGQPGIDTALPRFHRYAANTVLAGHNVAFDMRMLQMKRYVSSLRFTQPVLDTMMLSAIIHPYHRNHSLEAVSRRLGVRITGRHTAMGDAIAAAEILNKSLPLLARVNILTLGDARRASQRTRYSRVMY
jgi:DNA polymerase-3 subunit epsilon